MIFRRSKSDSRPSANLVIPPEGVPLYLEIAGVGVRLGAQITDILITAIAAVAFVILIYALGFSTPNTLMAIGALLFFIIRIPYYVLSELTWNGQTLGKRFLKIKVVAHSGGSLTTHAIVLRNLMKEAEVFLPGTLLITLDQQTPLYSWIAFGWVIGVLLVPLTDRYRRRLGDMMAGTHVIHLPEPILLADLARENGSKEKQFTFLPHHLDHYGILELQTLEDVLRAAERRHGTTQALQNQRETIKTIVAKIRTKISYADAVKETDFVQFLGDFYNAQRAHLEQRQLFGDRRQDKHHGTVKEQ